MCQLPPILSYHQLFLFLKELSVTSNVNFHFSEMSASLVPYLSTQRPVYAFIESPAVKNVRK